MAMDEAPRPNSVSEFITGLTRLEQRRADRFYRVALARLELGDSGLNREAEAAKRATLLGVVSIGLSAGALVSLGLLAALAFRDATWSVIARLALVVPWSAAAIGVGIRYAQLRGRFVAWTGPGTAIAHSGNALERPNSSDPRVVAPEMLHQMTRLERWSTKRWYMHRLSMGGLDADAKADAYMLADSARRTILNGIYYAGLIVGLIPVLALPYGMSGLFQGERGAIVWTASIGLLLLAILICCVVRHRQVNRCFRRIRADSLSS